MRARRRAVAAFVAVTVSVALLEAAAPAAGASGTRRLWRLPTSRVASHVAAPVVTVVPPAVTVSPLPAAPAGMRLVASDDFDRSTLGDQWGTYSGRPGGNADGWWDPANVLLRDGHLVLRGQRRDGLWVTGGANFRPARTTYGHYAVRMRMDPSAAVKQVALLWPASGRWPVDGEVDFSEDGGGDRLHTDGHLHWGADNSQSHATTKVDLTTWHTVGLDWAPGKVVYTMDGNPWATFTTGVPTGPMDLSFQTEGVACAGLPDCTSTADVDLEIDWVAVYAPV